MTDVFPVLDWRVPCLSGYIPARTDVFTTLDWCIHNPWLKHSCPWTIHSSPDLFIPCLVDAFLPSWSCILPYHTMAAEITSSVSCISSIDNHALHVTTKQFSTRTMDSRDRLELYRLGLRPDPAYRGRDAAGERWPRDDTILREILSYALL